MLVFEYDPGMLDIPCSEEAFKAAMDVYYEHGPSAALRAAGVGHDWEKSDKVMKELYKIAGWAPRPDE
eukprot:8037049-Alexandrium_andersonii.AAC.1